MDKKQLRSTLLLVLAALIWGCAFVAQSVGAEYVGAFTFLATRSWLGGIVLLPLIAALDGLDVLLSDVVMPGMSGTDLAAAARDLRPGLRVVLMTGTDPKDGATPAATVAAGSLPLLRKPFPAGALVAAVEGAGPC